jgi:hypothetical protein
MYKELMNDKWYVYSEYDADAISGFKRLGGRWSPSKRAWYFDKRNETELNAFLFDMFGHNGSDDYNKVDILLTVSPSYGTNDEYKIGTFPVAKRRERDNQVLMGEGCSIHKGSFPDSGGSRAHPCLANQEPVVVKILDLPEKLLQYESKKDYEILNKTCAETQPIELPEDNALASTETSELIEELKRRGFMITLPKEDPTKDLLDA